MDLKQIEYIITIAKSRTMTKAAEQLHISQSALSQSCHSLERELGLTLFHKVGRNLELTQDGLFFCEEGARLLDQANSFYTMLEQRKYKELHALHYYTDVVDNCDETILQYQQFFPDICFERIYSSEKSAVSSLKNGSLDFALTLRRIDEPSLCCEQLIDEPVVALVNKTSPYADLPSIALAMLDGEILTIYQNAESLKQLFLDFFTQAGAAPSRVLPVYDPVIQIQRNMGFIFMPQSTYHTFKARGMVGDCRGILIKDSFCRRRVFLTYNKKQHPRAICKAFFQYLRDYHSLSASEHSLPERERFSPSGNYQLTC
jgi:LysR family transcriptional activator of glutamate synthase operon